MSMNEGKQTQAQISIVTRIINSGGNRKFISIPKDYQDKIATLESKRVLVTITPLV